MDKLEKKLITNKEIKNFRFYLTNSKKITLGLIGKKIGGSYTPIQYSNKIGGILQLEWKNGEVSFVNITSSTLKNLNETIQNARKVSIKDEFSKKFIEPYKIKKPTTQFSSETNQIIDNNQGYLVKELRSLLQMEKEMKINQHKIEIATSQTEVNLFNSKGLNLSDNFTSYAISSDWDMKLYFTLKSRSPFKVKKYSANIKLLGKLFKAVNQPIKLTRFKEKKPTVILFPEFTWSILSHFIFSNLSGSLVANKLSRFKKSEFTKNKKYFAEWLTLEVNPLQELNPGSFNFTSEGVKTEPTVFIKKGKLKTPILDLKHAEKLKMKPTIGIDSPYTTTFINDSNNVQDLQEVIANTEEAILIPYCLGLNTQNQITGDYSLPSPYSIYIKDGKAVGSFKSIISSNIFSDFKEEIKFVKTDTFPSPGIIYKPNVIIE